MQLMVRSLSQVQSEAAIVRPGEVLLGRIQPGSQAAAASPADRLRESDRVLAAIESTAGVRSAALWALSKYIDGMLYGVSARDPWAYLIVCSLLILVALAAAYAPAHRAMRLEPLSVLHRE
jgi:putative ABC transport system permease protein